MWQCDDKMLWYVIYIRKVRVRAIVLLKRILRQCTIVALVQSHMTARLLISNEFYLVTYK